MPVDKYAEMRKRFDRAQDAVSAKYRACIDDIKFTFVPGEQWDAEMAAKRGLRPKYEFNKTRPVVKSVTNDMRQNDPSIKVVAAQNGKKHLAEILNGLIKSVEAQSRAATAYDTGGFYAAAGGYGVWEIATEYANDDVFEQDIRIKEKRNPFSILFDPDAKEFDKRDGRFAFELLDYGRDEFKSRWPNADACDFSAESAKYGSWFGDRIRVVKYWCKTAATKTIYQLSDGRVLDADDYEAMKPQLGQPGPNGEPPLTLTKQREVAYDKITSEICSGKETLEGPFEWAGKFIPLVPVWGESVNVEGEEHFAGIARPIKDAQRVFNWEVCVGIEVLANQPRAPLLYTAKMAEGYDEAYRNLGKDNAPGLPYNFDPDAPGGKPERLSPPAFPGGFFESAQFTADLIKSVSNVVDAPVQSRASSGKAIQAVEHQMDVGNFDYIDNLARAKAFSGEILVDLIPRIFDTAREVMILGEDGKESYVQLNQVVTDAAGNETIINDLSQGKYAVQVTVGPSFATQRMETVEAMKQVAANPNPQVAALGAYSLFKNMDTPGMDLVEKALRKQLIAQGLIEPGEGDEPPKEQQPDPKAQADAALKAAQATLAAANADKAKAETAQTRVETAITVQHAPMEAMRTAAVADHAMTRGYAAHPETPYWGPPQDPDPAGEQPPTP